MKNINWRMFLLLATPYVPIRLLSYLLVPRPYLWWHGVLDISAIVLYIVVAWLDGGKINER